MVINLFIILGVVTVLSLTISLIITFFYENMREVKRYELHVFKKKHSLKREKISDEYSKMSLEEYTYYRKNDYSKAASFAFELIDSEEEEMVSDFGLKIDYYLECKDDLSKFKNEVRELWKEFFEIDYYYGYSRALHMADIISLATLVRLSGISSEDASNLDDVLLKFINDERENFNDWDGREDFKARLIHIIEWSKFRFSGYLDIMNLGVSINEFETVKRFWKNNEENFSKLRSESPSLSISFFSIVKAGVERFNKDSNRYRFIQFYLQVSVWVLEAFKELDLMNEYSETFINYRRIKRDWKFNNNNKKSLILYGEYILDYATGYGEKPIRLLYLFFASIGLFTLIYYPFSFSPFNLNSIENSDGIVTSLINLLYFNFTTMLSNLYGNISPENEVTKVFVIFQQTIGFTITGSFIALFLRKIFRD